MNRELRRYEIGRLKKNAIPTPNLMDRCLEKVIYPVLVVLEKIGWRALLVGGFCLCYAMSLSVTGYHALEQNVGMNGIVEIVTYPHGGLHIDIESPKSLFIKSGLLGIAGVIVLWCGYKFDKPVKIIGA